MKYNLHNLNITGIKQEKIYFLFILLVSIFYLIVSVHVPLSILVWQTYDDMLFINHGQSLAEGKWLGDFNELTLVKGPGYSLFLAFNNWLGLPISFSHALFYCGSLLILSCLVLKITKSYLMAFLLFVITLWEPRIFEFSRVLRDDIYSGQVIMVLSFFSFSLFLAKADKEQDIFSALSGMTLGWFWLTREEGVWLLPGIAVLFIFAATRKKLQLHDSKIIRPLVISSAFYFLVQFSFMYGNFIAYGKFVSLDIKEKNFQTALKLMESVRVGGQIPYLSVPHKVREQIYKVSPSFSELKKYIDPEDSASTWIAGGCRFRPTTCGDIGNGFYMWALREAAGKAGYYSSPQKASEFFKLISIDIENACRDKRLRCEKNPIPYMPPITFEQLKTIPSVFKAVWNSISSIGTLNDSTTWKVWGPEYKFNSALTFLNHPLHYPMMNLSTDVEFDGWYRSNNNRNDWFQLTVSDDYNMNLPFELTRKESKDLVNYFRDKDASNQRFKITTRCSDGCKLTFSTSQNFNFIVPIKNTKKYLSNADGMLAFDSINIEKDIDYLKHASVKFSSKVISFFHFLYKNIIQYLLTLGLLAFAFSCLLAFKKNNFSVIFAIASACWISIVARAAILVLVDISSFPAITVNYMLPIFVLSKVASLLSIGTLIDYFLIKASLNYQNLIMR